MTQFPTTLMPSATLALETAQGVLDVPLTRPSFAAYNGPLVVDRFGNKDLLHVDDKPQFAEVAILRAFETEGWQGRWVEVYGHMHSPAFWLDWRAGGPGAQQHEAIIQPWVNEQLKAIAVANGGNYGGCWDVVAWKNDRLVFAEAKLQKKDKMRPTQLRWLEAALKCGCAVEDFLVVEWTLLAGAGE